MKKMLVIEDDLLTQNVLRKIFRGNYELDVCESGEEYYEKYSNNKYDIMIMDVAIKGSKNGLNLIKEIKSAPITSGTPIICLTAHVQMKMRQTAIESGSDLFITKPVSIHALREAVASLLKKNNA